MRISRLSARAGLCVCALLAVPLASPAALAAETTPGRPLVKGVYDDWRVACVDQSAKNCSAYQELYRRDNGKVVMRIEVQHGADRAAMTLLLPLGVQLAHGVVVQVDDQAPSSPYPFTACLEQGCVAPVALDAATLRAARRGRLINVTVVSLRGDSISFALPLRGFDAAFAALPVRGGVERAGAPMQ